ncbi:hypothetical protein PV08_08221 [Exophiala spinifera]|uniref:Uncharacterized protein n=1 Tax=Exophiala spinifera TaxID=91928 RepID=A0A0D2BPM8_9EURO|nr:uncharacterized protein PV08_08221 [Exophiala spinifera]KIW13034.1 hypothetical protein PV08_08221 [Exophiala spinifera]
MFPFAFSLFLVSGALGQSVSQPSPTSTLEPCAQIRELQKTSLAADPAATVFRFPPEVAYECQLSVPIVQNDAFQIIDGLRALVEWQSTLGWLKNPPAGYPFRPVDLVGGLEELRSQVQSGHLKSELEFEWKLIGLLSSARDGHLQFHPDADFVFSFRNPIGNLVSVSSDGRALPEVYLYSELIRGISEGWEPSAISKLNDIDIVEWLTYEALNTTFTFQDPDANYNFLFYSNTGSDGAFFANAESRYNGTDMTVNFKNGSTASYGWVAATAKSFAAVEDGTSFYNAFCNVTQKLSNTDPGSSAATSDASPGASDPNQLRPLYPKALVISDDASIAGYFSESDPDTAILSINGFSEGAAPSAQQTMTSFLNMCREQNKTRLIIDLSQNGGGTIMLAYDYFKQLFPSLEPYLAGQLRAHEQLDVLGQYFTPLAEQAQRDDPSNLTYLTDRGRYGYFDARSFVNDSGQIFDSWDDFYGPVDRNGDKFTNLFQLYIRNADYDHSSGAITVSGYANNSEIAPQPFDPENIITFTDGYCASACTIFMHLMRYQAKVKTIVAGGRPQMGPMQYVGGVKGSLDMPLDYVYNQTKYLYDHAPKEMIERANKTLLKSILDYGSYLQLRSVSPQALPSVNGQNAISQYDSSETPLQFVTEAADCRIWFQPIHMVNITALWDTVGQQAFGLNDTKPYSLCVKGSTNDPTSLNGNGTFYDDGRLANVTGYDPDNNGTVSGTEDGNNSGSIDGTNGASSLSNGPTILMVLALCSFSALL